MNPSNDSQTALSRLPFAISKIIITTLFIVSPASAQVFVDLPDLLLNPNSSETFDIFVRNDGGSPFAVNGVEFNIQVEDGGPEYGGSIDGPAITAVQLIEPGMLFGANNNGQGGAGGAWPQMFQRSTATSSGTVGISPGSSLLGKVTFDTTGLAPGNYSYTLNTLEYGPLFFTIASGGGVFGPDEGLNLLGGTLTVIPEPSDYAAIAGVGCLIWAAVRRRHSHPESAAVN